MPLVPFLALVLAAEPIPAPAPYPLDDIDAVIGPAMTAAGVPGLAIAIVRDDAVVFAKGYGVRKLGETAPVDARTCFAVASVTKAFTAALLGTMVDAKTLTWDDPVIRHLPDFQMSDPIVTRELTVRDILSHRSGLPAYGGDVMWSLDLPRHEIVRRARLISPASSFRAKPAYQNVMYLVAGQLAAVANGRPWDDLVAEKFFRPLGMTRTSTSIRVLAGMDNVATPHAEIDGKLTPIAYRNLDSAGPAGGINSCVTDLAQWLRMWLRQGTFPGEGGGGERVVLKAATVKEMHTPQSLSRLEGVRAKLSPLAHFRAAGLGWMLEDYRGRKLIEHGGNIDGWTAQVALMPEERLGLVLLANRNNSALPRALMYQVLDGYLGGPTRDWPAEFLKVEKEQVADYRAKEEKVEKAKVAGTKPSVPESKLVGAYRSELYGVAMVTRPNDKLVLTMSPRLVADLEHFHYDTYLATWRNPLEGKSLVTWMMTPRGTVMGLRIADLADPDTTDLMFPRVPDEEKKDETK